jgi:regulator of sirC expression with transglutaminase-like and TPR domain
VSEKVRVLGTYLFDELGFSGDRDDYAAARNSFLDQVLERRRGLPITLSVLYVALSRRLGLRAAGISFPSHFLVLVQDENGSRVLDPFGGGRWLSLQDLNARLEQLYGDGAPTVEAQPGLLRPAATREILVRMLRNLKTCYQKQGDALNSLVAIEAILGLEPDLIEEIGDRALAYRDLGHSSAAAEDLRRYLAATEDAREVARMQGLLEELERAPTRLH